MSTDPNECDYYDVDMVGDPPEMQPGCIPVSGLFCAIGNLIHLAKVAT